MKTKREKNVEVRRKSNRQIWKDLSIEKVIGKHGFDAVKGAVTAWLNYQRENAKLLKEKRELETKLKEVEAKL